MQNPFSPFNLWYACTTHETGWDGIFTHKKQYTLTWDLYAISIMPPALFLVGKQDEKHEWDSGGFRLWPQPCH